jgi:hypothetical protein
MQSSLLWEIRGDAIEHPSFLFGTMHVQDSRAFQRSQTVLEKISQCSAFAAECNLSSAMEAFDGAAMMLPAGQTLQTLIPPGKYRKLRKTLLKSVKLDIDYLKHSLPFTIINLLTSRMLDSDMPKSLDEHLWHFAEQEGKTMLGIETLAEQLAVLEKIPTHDQVKMLVDIGKNIGRYRKHLLHLAELYARGDMRQLYQSVKKSSKGLRKLMLYRRNEIMAERISELAQAHSIFVAIGAGHLYGGKGVVRLLKRKGWKVTPIPVTRTASP